MTPKLIDIVNILEKIAPLELSESWDNSGLQIGRHNQPVKRIWVSLDPLSEVVSSACARNVDLLITHHPLILKPLSNIDFDTPVGSIIEMAVMNKMAIFSAHTNLDRVNGGINDVLAEKISLTALSDLVDSEKCGKTDRPLSGLGRIGDLKTPVSLEELVLQIKEKIGLARIRYVGDPRMMITRAAVCSGSGGSMMKDFIASDAQVYITGDLKYHDAIEARQRGRALVDFSHFASEHLMLSILAERVQNGLRQAGFKTGVTACDLEKEPFSMI